MRRITPVVSVVVPTYRRDALLDRCLAALVAQTCDRSAYEVIVADDAASEATRHLVALWAARSCISIRYISVNGTRGPAAARNRGWRAAAGDIIAFTDDDCIPDPGWLAAAIRAFNGDRAAVMARAEAYQSANCVPRRTVSTDRRIADGTIMGVWGRIIVPLPPGPTDYERDAAGLEIAEFATANCFYRRDALEAVGGFDERFTAAWREDADLFFLLLERGHRVAHAPQAVVVHPVRPAPWGVSIRQQRKSMFNALLYKKHPALYRARIQAMPPLHYYRIVGALIATVVGILNGNRALTQIGGGLWLVFTGRFVARRLCGTSHAPRHVMEMVATSLAIPPLSVFWRLRGAFKFRVPFL